MLIPLGMRDGDVEGWERWGDEDGRDGHVEGNYVKGWNAELGERG